MPRSGSIKNRKLAPDPIYQSKVLNKLINRSMISGKKTVAQKEVYRAMKIVNEKLNQDPIVVFSKALDNIRPLMEVRSRRVGGAAYQVPAPVRGERRDSLAIRWLLQAAKARSSKDFHTFAEKLAVEIIDAFNNSGGAVKKKDDTHRMADANKAFAHFRW